MAQWYVNASGDERDPLYLRDKILLVELSNGKDRALAFVYVFGYTPASVSPYGLPQSAKAAATIEAAIPLTKGAAPTKRDVVEVYSGQALEVLPLGSKLRLRYIDQRGVPWQIEGYWTPPEGFTKPVVAWTSHYYGDEGVAVEGDTLEDVRTEIKKVQASQFRNPPPTLDASTALRDDQGPIVVKDEDGDFQLHGATVDGKYTIWAARLGGFQADVVGPSASVPQARADVAAYRHDLARASNAASLVESFSGRALSPLGESDTSRLSTPEPETSGASKPTSSLWVAALAFGGAGLLLWLTTSQESKRGLY